MTFAARRRESRITLNRDVIDRAFYSRVARADVHFALISLISPNPPNGTITCRASPRCSRWANELDDDRARSMLAIAGGDRFLSRAGKIKGKL